MRKETYERIFAKIQSKKYGVMLVRISGRTITYITALCYIAAVAHSFFQARWRMAPAFILAPAVSFLAVSIFRRICNAGRPYEIYGFTPLIAKDTRGKSFPSRHVFSVFVIGSTIAWAYPAAGGAVCLMGCVLAAIRVAVGVHFPRDVIAGGLIGIACGCLAGILL